MAGRGDEYARLVALYDPATARALGPLRRLVASLASSRAPGRALDVCCGTGRQCALFAGAGFEATGLDLSPAMLARAAVLPGAGRFVQGDAARLPFGGGLFAVTSVTLALHEKSPELRPLILSEMIRVTAPGGLLLVADYAAARGLPGLAQSFGVGLVERLAGREHHAFYRHFMAQGGLEGLLGGVGLRPAAVIRRFAGLMGVAVIERDRATGFVPAALR